jgi:hypothetical protein
MSALNRCLLSQFSPLQGEEKRLNFLNIKHYGRRFDCSIFSLKTLVVKTLKYFLAIFAIERSHQFTRRVNFSQDLP